MIDGELLAIAQQKIANLHTVDPDRVPVDAVMALWELHSGGSQLGNVESCYVMSECFGLLGVQTEFVPVALTIARWRTEEIVACYGKISPTDPRAESWHFLLRVRKLSALCDPSSPALPELAGVAGARHVAQFPVGDWDRVGGIVVARGETMLVYQPVNAAPHDVWQQSATTIDRLHCANLGSCLAAEVLDALRWNSQVARLDSQRWARVRSMIAAIGDAPLRITDGMHRAFQMPGGEMITVKDLARSDYTS
ncbi:hypothetical protein [Stackebrandtia nassauensis]|uniref:Uncharacterized protein n=1 Tax=Stackebrandtia nassauensis (strain DSM 44728 / CIP 108903 / NRRL B-16338 / NBRC 102104 / LLR-40K-21) TaxID=446470 RepID=D3Q4L3_STANL|nr:hypothetical protein [Stackebrandtia nassauensis]ADD40173.1 hypothetical protein Snas_0458 [Stackebrandtia nassauensis DSM 44728]